MTAHTRSAFQNNLKSKTEFHAKIRHRSAENEVSVTSNHVTLIRSAPRSTVTLVTLKSTFTINGATHTGPRKVLLKSDCSERNMCYYRDRSGKLNNVPRNGHLVHRPEVNFQGQTSGIRQSDIYGSGGLCSIAASREPLPELLVLTGPCSAEDVVKDT